MGDWIREPQSSLLRNEQRLFVGTDDGGLLPQAQQCNVNFLWQENNVYVMDNHLAAGWCWLQECNPDEEYKFLHIDQHTDDGCELDEKEIRTIIDPLALKNDFDKYCGLSYNRNGVDIPLFQCERYIRPISVIYHSWFSKCIFATYQEHNLQVIQKLVKERGFQDYLHTPQNIKSHDLIQELRKLMNSDAKWIVNIDLDYFFYGVNMGLPDDFASKVSSFISNVRDNIQVVTIALSTPWSGGLMNSLDILSVLSKDIPELQQFSMEKYL